MIEYTVIYCHKYYVVIRNDLDLWKFIHEVS